MQAAPALNLNALDPSTELEAMEYRAAAARGTFIFDDQVALRNQYWGIPDGPAEYGYHLLTPLLLEDGRAVLIDRGWIPGSYADPASWHEFDEPGEAVVKAQVAVVLVLPLLALLPRLGEPRAPGVDAGDDPGARGQAVPAGRADLRVLAEEAFPGDARGGQELHHRAALEVAAHEAEQETEALRRRVDPRLALHEVRRDPGPLEGRGEGRRVAGRVAQEDGGLAGPYRAVAGAASIGYKYRVEPWPRLVGFTSWMFGQCDTGAPGSHWPETRSGPLRPALAWEIGEAG